MIEEYIYKNTVQPSWIDNNNHMHDAQYYSVFSDAVAGFLEHIDFQLIIVTAKTLQYLTLKRTFLI